MTRSSVFQRVFRALFVSVASSLLILGCAPAVPPAATGPVSPPPPPPSPRITDYVSAGEVQRNVEQKVVEVAGPNALREAQGAGISIMAVSYQGRFDSGGPRVNVAVRSSGGWRTWKTGRPAPLAGAAAAELDRLLAEPAFWREEPFYPNMDCPDAGATMMVVRHKGQVKVTRQGCSPEGLTGRLEETVLNEAVPSPAVPRF